jgi:hypothetical protein
MARSDFIIILLILALAALILVTALYLEHRPFMSNHAIVNHRHDGAIKLESYGGHLNF